MIRQIVSITTPLLLAASGGLLTELSGALNIGLEGLILIGAFTGVLAGYFSGSIVVGYLAAGFAGIMLALLFAVFGQRLRANIFVVGLAINLLAAGIATILSGLIFQNTGTIKLPPDVSAARIVIPAIHDIPVIGELFSGHMIITYASWPILVLVSIVLARSPFGLELRVSGTNPEALEARGKNPFFFREVAGIVSGLTCGLAGAALSLGLGAYVPNISAGRGWIALVTIYLGQKRPVGIVIACIVFAAAEYLANTMQGRMNIPRTLTLAVPYLVTLAGMVAFAIVRSKNEGDRTGLNVKEKA